jgi:hypothetical protein
MNRIWLNPASARGGRAFVLAKLAPAVLNGVSGGRAGERKEARP